MIQEALSVTFATQVSSTEPCLNTKS